MKPVPRDYDAFLRRFVAICRDRLELTPAAAYAIEIAEKGQLGLPLVPPAAMRLIRPILKQPGRAVAFGCVPTYVRQRMDIPWTNADRRALGLLMTVLQTGGSVVPSSVNQRAMRFSLRRVGARTRAERYRLPSR
jgi:uncharacterized protein (DUF2236 family)